MSTFVSYQKENIMKKQAYAYGSWGSQIKNLPCSARMKARRNIAKNGNILKEKSHTTQPIHCGFNWMSSSEGLDYWEKIAFKYGL